MHEHIRGSWFVRSSVRVPVCALVGVYVLFVPGVRLLHCSLKPKP